MIFAIDCWISGLQPGNQLPNELQQRQHHTTLTTCGASASIV